jgi:hypothetical protein
MKQKICYYIHTEYHLISSLNDIQNNYSNSSEEVEITLLLKRTKDSKRLNKDLNLDGLPYKILILPFKANLKAKLLPEERSVLEDILSLPFDVFNFFQEQDPLAIILINHFKSKGAKIHLYQDGLKPYVIQSMKFSFGLIMNDIQQNIWIRKNGYIVKNYWSFLHCKKYGFLYGVDKLFLSFPAFYPNWNALPIESVSTEISQELVSSLQQLFNWHSDMLKIKSGVIFYMNQPLNDDSLFDEVLLGKLNLKYPEAKIFIKTHPLTSQAKRDYYKGLPYVTVLDYAIPAELFVSQLENSIVLSLFSTAMFMNNLKCKFYYLFDIPEAKMIERLNKVTLINPTNHIVSAKNMEEILF